MLKLLNKTQQYGFFFLIQHIAQFLELKKSRLTYQHNCSKFIWKNMKNTKRPTQVTNIAKEIYFMNFKVSSKLKDRLVCLIKINILALLYKI